MHLRRLGCSMAIILTGVLAAGALKGRATERSILPPVQDTRPPNSPNPNTPDTPNTPNGPNNPSSPNSPNSPPNPKQSQNPAKAKKS